MQQQANFGRLFLRPLIVLIIVLAVAIGFVIGFGELLLKAHGWSGDAGKSSLARREVWVDLVPAILIVLVAGLIAYSPKGRFGVLEARTLVGKQPIFTPPAPGAADVSRRGLPGEAADVAPGYSLFYRGDPLGYVVGRVPAGGGAGPFLYVAGYEGSARQIWVPLSAVSEVYPDTKTAYLTARIEQANTWATRPAALPASARGRR